MSKKCLAKKNNIQQKNKKNKNIGYKTSHLKEKKSGIPLHYEEVAEILAVHQIYTNLHMKEEKIGKKTKTSEHTTELCSFLCV